MRKKSLLVIGIFLGIIVLAILGPVLWHLAKTYRSSRSKEAGEKALERIFKEHGMDLPMEYIIVAFDHTPIDFQGKANRYYELKISDGNFLEGLDTERTERMDIDFAAMADLCDYRGKNGAEGFEEGTVLDREKFFEAARIKYDKTESLRTLFMWYDGESKIVYILHSDG